MFVLTSFLAGLVFGLGLIVSGMANPAKVLGFLDVAGPWDPSLALVMVGAIAVGLLAFYVAKKRTRSFLGAPMKLPTATRVDRPLLVGAMLFGVGWGIAGFCPGPALVALGMGEWKALVFVLAMLAGMGLFEVTHRGRVGCASPRSVGNACSLRVEQTSAELDAVESAMRDSASVVRSKSNRSRCNKVF